MKPPTYTPIYYGELFPVLTPDERIRMAIEQMEHERRLRSEKYDWAKNALKELRRKEMLKCR